MNEHKHAYVQEGEKWVCSCGDTQEWVPFMRTVEGQASFARVREAEAAFKDKLNTQYRAAMRMGLEMAVETARQAASLTEVREVLAAMLAACPEPGKEES